MLRYVRQAGNFRLCFILMSGKLLNDVRDFTYMRILNHNCQIEQSPKLPCS